VKKTVTICQETEKEEQIPDEIKNRLFKVLNLGDISSDKK